ncbi:MAG: hypothetical protein ABI783_07665, partial [Actinomycetota bacterium]
RMGRLGVTCLSLAVLVLVPVTGSASTTSGLRGRVTVSPSRPVCIEGQPCSKPAPGVLIAFKRDGRIAARVTTRADATYRVILPPGRYTVAAPQYRRGSGVTPHTVRVLKGRMAHVDLEIDTGIQ